MIENSSIYTPAGTKGLQEGGERAGAEQRQRKRMCTTRRLGPIGTALPPSPGDKYAGAEVFGEASGTEMLERGVRRCWVGVAAARSCPE